MIQIDNIQISKQFKIIIGCSGLALFAGFTLKRYLHTRKYDHIPGPKLNGILDFYFGNLSELRAVLRGDLSFAEKILEWSQEYGNVVKYRIGGQVFVFLNEPEHIKTFYIEKAFPKAESFNHKLGFPCNERVLGYGLLTNTNHATWHEARALFNNEFHRSALMYDLNEFNIQGNLLVEKLRLLADGRTVVKLSDYVSRATLEAISNTVLRLNSASLSDELNQYLYDAQEAIASLILDPLIKLMPNKRSLLRKYIRSIRKLRSFAVEQVQERIRDIRNDERVPEDIITQFLKKSINEEREIDFETIVDHFLTFFGAGLETTANAITSCIFMLCQNPSALEKLRNEIDTVLGSKTEISNEDLIKMEYLSCVFKETLRVLPPAAYVFRDTHEDTCFSGHFVPKRTSILVSAFVMGRNPKHFPEPEKFKPERFLANSEESRRNNINSYTYFPFSLGARNCIGQNFAKMEGKVLIAKLIQNFDLRIDTTQSFKLKDSLTLRPLDGCCVYISLRNLFF